MEIKDPSSIFYDPRLEKMSFEEYLVNIVEEDSVTKRLLCRQSNDTSKSLEQAKDILRNSETGVFDDYYESFLQFKTALPSWKFLSLRVVDECIKTKLYSK